MLAHGLLTAALFYGCAAAAPDVNRRGEAPDDAGIAPPVADAGEPGPTEPPIPEPDAGSTPSDPLVPPGPRPLRCGRTYDHEADYLAVSGEASRVMLRHRDNTALPAYEGGASCADGCMEEVVRLEEGASITGSFAGVATFSAQAALTSEEGAGTLVVEACGVEVGRYPLRVERSSVPGFVNHPSPAWPVPTDASCAFTLRAVGGFADVRAVTTTCVAEPEPPVVDLRVDGEDGPISLPAPASFTLSWDSLHAAECEVSGAWTGTRAPDGSEAMREVPAGTYTYAITCSNAAGTASDHVTVEVTSAPI